MVSRGNHWNRCFNPAGTTRTVGPKEFEPIGLQLEFNSVSHMFFKDIFIYIYIYIITSYWVIPYYFFNPYGPPNGETLCYHFVFIVLNF